MEYGELLNLGSCTEFYAPHHEHFNAHAFNFEITYNNLNIYNVRYGHPDGGIPKKGLMRVEIIFRKTHSPYNNNECLIPTIQNYAASHNIFNAINIFEGANDYVQKYLIQFISDLNKSNYTLNSYNQQKQQIDKTIQVVKEHLLWRYHIRVD